MNKVITAVLFGVLSSFAQGPGVRIASNSPVGVVPAIVATSTIVGSVKPALAPVASSIKSFKEWKNERVQVAIKKVTITKAQIEYKKLNKQFLQRTETVNPKDPEMDRLESQLKDDIYALEVAQGLGVTEYFAVYLIKQENKEDAYKEAAVKMSDDEVNQLIRAFADSMFATSGNSKPSFKVGPTAMDKLDTAK